jgi:hypothetical protein
MAEQFVSGGAGFDIYPAGALASNFPWSITNSSLAGTINATAGAFGGCALTFPETGVSLASGFAYQFMSSMNMVRGNTAAGGSGAFAVNLWLNVNTISPGSGTLLSLGSSSNTAVSYPLLNISNSSSGGTNLQFITNINNPTSSPYSFTIQTDTYYWIQLQFAYYSTTSSASSGVLLATYSINNVAIQSAIPITWGSDVFTAGQVANQLKFYTANFLQYFVDDMVIQTVSSADTIWPLGAGVDPVPSTLPAMTARRIYAIPASGAGSDTQWTPSGGEPNWQSATDTTGANFVTATAVAQTDTYKWNAPTMTDVRALIAQGNANRYANITGSFKTSSGGSLVQMETINGPSRYVSVTETDGTNPWTTTSINAGEFGQTSR